MLFLAQRRLQRGSTLFNRRMFCYLYANNAATRSSLLNMNRSERDSRVHVQKKST